MKSVKLIACFLILLTNKKLFCGCTGPSCHTSNGIGYYSGVHPFGQATEVNESAFFSIYLQGSNCSSTLTKTRVFYKGVLVDSFLNSIRTLTLTIPQKPGRYRITSIVNCPIAGFYNLSYTWSFDLYQKPMEVLNIIDSEANKIIELNTELLLYPNPATNNITLLNETEEIKKITVYSLSGQIINTIDVHNTKIEIPLENIPPGIYVIHVATLSDKIIIKKFSVL